MSGKEISVHPVRPRSDDTRKLAARLAPFEELGESGEATRAEASQLVAQENGAIVVGGEQSELVKEVIAAEERSGGLRLEPVVIVIVGLMLAFIAFIAWQISRMPASTIN